MALGLGQGRELSKLSALERRKNTCPAVTKEGVPSWLVAKMEMGLSLLVLFIGCLIQHVFIEHLLFTRHNS